MSDQRQSAALMVVAVSTGMALMVARTLAQEPTPRSAETTAAGLAVAWTPSRTPDGQPDLQGTWVNFDSTPFEAGEAPRAQTDVNPPSHWTDHDSPLSAQRRSMVVDPPDGRVPVMRWAEDQRDYHLAHIPDAPEHETPWVRCITRGVPGGMFPAGYNNGYEIIQIPGYVVIVYEMIHDTRVIPLDGRPHIGSGIRMWNGDSRGRWEGDTLVVETTNYNDKGSIATSAATGRIRGISHSEELHVVERFTRVSADAINYVVTITDPKVYTQPWTVALPLNRDDTYVMFEYACHEGNLALPNALSAGRVRDREAAAANAPTDVRADAMLPSTSARQMTDAAVALVALLSPEQQQAAMLPLAGESRTNWSNTPPYVHPRPGLRIGALSAEQRLAVHELLRASLSSQGYQKVAGVMRLDDIHRERTLAAQPADASEYTRAANESLGTANYSFALFGDPRAGTDWAWLIQGHHLGASFTVAGNDVGFTPLFLGAAPLATDRGPDIGWSALPNEVARGRELMAALSAAQQSAATVGDDVPSDVVNGVGRKRSLTKPEGLSVADMTAAQQQLLRRLVEEYVHNAGPDAAEAQLAVIAAADWNEVRFAWRGPADDPAQPFYYRVQGARILIECRYEPNHIHTIMRDPANDYGERWLGLQYIEEFTAADRFAAAQRRAAEHDAR
ncbi:MAG TPA: DUF3500 domain-containing protein [Gammaproteobacteria bacterium]|nr:DUF3500 domain-containing protein [Gammaproteobacteria bacterium]